MRKILGFAFVAVLLLGASAAEAWHISGYVACDANGDGILNVGDTPMAGVVVRITGDATLSGQTDANGFYYIVLPDVPANYVASLDPATLPGDAVVVIPGPTFPFSVTDGSYEITQHWLVQSATCSGQEGTCWLTAGGAKFSPITNMGMAEKGPQHSFGGNVNPSCSPYPGEGGQWNHLAHRLQLHFLGRAIQVVRCGNVPGIPEGSESPATPFNFIEFQGTGTLKGIKGNNADYGIVHFFARAEDRNEPGSSGAKDGALIDRYFIHVFSDPGNAAGTTLLLLDIDGDPATVDPITITDGNLQIHISSCTPQ